MRAAIAILTAATALMPLIAAAEDSPEAIALESRKGYMQMLGVNMGTLAAMAKGDVAYDEAAASTAAANIDALARYTVGMHFLKGTAAGEMEDSEAQPKIWEDPAGFAQKFTDFQTAAAGAGEAVKGGADKLGPVVGKIGGTCKACHDDYRKQ